jgi:hypothetical protein
MPARVMKRHDTKVTPRVRLLDDAGQPLVLTGLTVRYSLRALGATTLKVNRQTAIVTDQQVTPGEVFYQFVAADVDTAGIYEEEWEVDYGSGVTESFPVHGQQIVQIVADVDNT